ncbi:glycosyltransferase [Luminiphilus sp.]|nr:glycosyltransferase [Luminiphilus sp.]MDA8986208.1 glycosyltransferase [Luminiphilus sp.]
MSQVSIVVRTLNEEKYLDELLSSIAGQRKIEPEVVVIDSGSTDRTIEIARQHGCKITNIEKKDFSFGRSLNKACEFASGDVLVFISGHCVPFDELWLLSLVDPILSGEVDYCYGRQVGRHPSKFSENQLFLKYYPAKSAIPQNGIFVNNANAAISRDAWEKFLFDEELTGLEDMHLANRMVRTGGKVGYSAMSVVYHIHDETWGQTRRRYERESLALQKIMPEVQVGFFDTVRYIVLGVMHDCVAALRQGCLLRNFISIFSFRVAQYMGTYSGNNFHRQMSRRRKEAYFYPTGHVGEKI